MVSVFHSLLYPSRAFRELASRGEGRTNLRDVDIGRYLDCISRKFALTTPDKGRILGSVGRLFRGRLVAQSDKGIDLGCRCDQPGLDGLGIGSRS